MDVAYLKLDCPVKMKQLPNDGLVEFNVCVDKRKDHAGYLGEGFGMTDCIPYLVSMNMPSAKTDVVAELEGWQIRMMVELAEEMGVTNVDLYWSEMDEIPQVIMEFYKEEFNEPIRAVVMQLNK